MAAARRWLRAVLYRTGVQFGWLWLAAVAWFAVIALPDGRWNRTFDARATATITSIHGEVGAEDPDLLIEYVFRANGREYTNHGIEANAGPEVVTGIEVEVAYVSSDPHYSELRVPGVRSRYRPVSHDLPILGVFALVALVPMFADGFRAMRELRKPGESSATSIAERKRPAIWFLFVLPLATLAGVATLVILYYA